MASLLRCAVVLVSLERVLCGKAGGGKSNGKSNGKTFSVTGTWALSETFIEKSRCSNATKGSSGIDCAYKLDVRLATCLAHFFRGLSVTELGAGVGRYKTHVDNSGMAREYIAYDGLLNVAELTQGRVQHVDLTVDTPSLRRSDFALSLEVAEHIPAMFEQTLFRNIDRSNRLGVVISWSNMGSSQSAHGCLLHGATWRIAMQALICARVRPSFTSSVAFRSCDARRRPQIKAARAALGPSRRGDVWKRHS